ncbi:hypothetical protein [Flammeovirga sp. SubArs3]|uniref:tetratricopeptide repeat protein n=1 Tax=Flammeovirga sp. SubArs3 TaxID=2995316 RepID=UPI00248B6C05|nr:hypothetical protein [Flammeovirga sp. SubArs3]
MLLPFFSSAQVAENDSIKIKEHDVSEIQYTLDSLLSYNYHIEAQQVADSVIQIAKDTYSNTDERIVLLHKRIAEKFADRGFSNIASQYIQQGLSILRSQPSPNYAFIGDMYIYLAQIFRHHQLSNIAINYYEQAAESYEQSEGTNHYYNLINVYMTLGTFHFEVKNFGTSSSYYTKASNIIAKMDTEYRADMVEILNRIAVAQTATGSFKKAQQNLLRSEMIAKKVFGKNALELENVYEQLIDMYIQKSEFDSADIYAVKAVKILKGNIGTTERRQKYERFLADTFFGNREYSLACKWYDVLYDDAYITNQNSLEEIATITDWYITIGEKMERVKQDSLANNVYEKALSVNQKYFGEENLKAASIMHKISRTQTKLNYFEQAEIYTNKAYAIEWDLGTEKDSTQFIVQQIDLAGLLLMKGDTTDAEDLYHKVLELEDDRESRWKAIAFNNLTMIHLSALKYDSANYFAEQLLVYYSTNYGRDYIKTLGCYLLLGNIAFAQGMEQEAVEKYYSKPIRLAPQLFSKKNEVALLANLNLSRYYAELNKEDLSRRYDSYAREIQVYLSSKENYP